MTGADASINTVLEGSALSTLPALSVAPAVTAVAPSAASANGAVYRWNEPPFTRYSIVATPLPGVLSAADNAIVTGDRYHPARPGVPDATTVVRGAAVSIVIERADVPTKPLASVARAVILVVPSVGMVNGAEYDWNAPSPI